LAKKSGSETLSPDYVITGKKQACNQPESLGGARILGLPINVFNALKKLPPKFESWRQSP